MVQDAKALATRSYTLSVIPRTKIAKEKKNPHKMSSDFYMHTVTCVLTHKTHTHTTSMYASVYRMNKYKEKCRCR